LGTIGRPELAEQIRWALPGDPNVPASTPLTMSFLAHDAALIERLVPVPGRWLSPAPGGSEPPHAPLGSAREVVEAPEAIIAAHQRRAD
nr:hypothetical protein [Chloroflexota bacterium]